MAAGRAESRRLDAFMNIATIQAAPFDRLCGLEQGAILDPLLELQITMFVEFLGNGNGAHGGGDVLETFFLSGFCKRRVHGVPFIMLASSSLPQVDHGIRGFASGELAGNLEITTLKEAPEALGMLGFLMGSFQKDFMGNDNTVFFGLFGKEGITVARLGFSGKGGENIFLGLCSLE